MVAIVRNFFNLCGLINIISGCRSDNENNNYSLTEDLSKEVHMSTTTAVPTTITDESSVTETSPSTSTWYTTSEFETRSETKTLCPEGLTFFQHFLGPPMCYVLTQKQRYPPICPYQNYLEYDAIRDISEKYRDQSIWLRAIRDHEDGFGQFEWLDPSNRYKTPVREYENPADNIMDRKCMIRHLNSNIPVFCNEEHPVLCVYSYTSMSIEKYCSKRNNFNRCISTSLNLDNQCYCMANVGGIDISRNEFCAKLAEPLDPFQNHLLLNQLANKSPCWFGLENVGGKYHWSSLNKTTNYTVWKDDIDMSKRYAALDYTKPKGWILEDDYALKCAVCETKVEYQNVTITLKYLPNQNKLEILVKNVLDVHNYFILQYVLACFTDSNVDGLQTKILSMITDLFSINDQYYVKTIEIDNYYPSYFWCETFQRPNLTLVVSNKILAYKDNGKHGHEYALVIRVMVKEGIDPYLKNLHVKAAAFINNTLQEKTAIVNAVRPMRVLELSQINEYMRLLLHMSSTRNTLPSDEEYKIIRNVLEQLKEHPLSPVLNVERLARSDICLADETKTGNMILHWTETRIGVTSSPRELCLLRNSTPVVRRCGGDFLFGAEWEEVQGECDDKANLTQTTVALYKLLHSEEPGKALSKTLHDITERNKDVLMVDVHFIAILLEKLTAYEDLNVTEISCTLSNMMRFRRNVLKEAQTLLNCTDKTLHVLDQITSTINLSKGVDYLHVKTEGVLIQVSDLRASNVTGAVVKKSDTAYSIYPIYNEDSLEELLKDKNTDSAVILPLDHIEELKKCMKEEKYPEIKLIITFFCDDTLFNEKSEDSDGDHKSSNGRVISVSIPGSSCTFHVPISIIFKSFDDDTKTDCGHWNYGNNQLMESIHGKWKIDSTPDVDQNKYRICHYNHTTHFALLMIDENRQDEIPEKDVLALNIITLIGCGISLVGLAGIFITAIAFKKWRRRSRNIIMLNFSASLAAQTILLFVADNVREDSLMCLISGASLHYTVLAEFAWMLMIAVLQYRKFVMVFQKPIPYLILKCIIFGWCLPLVPVAILFAICPETYAQNSLGLCYPKGEYFLYGVALPIAIIILINLFVFFKILLNICNRQIEAYGSKDSDIKLQVLLAILLFFLLGMSWLFGLATTLSGWIVLSYLFCLTATLQGFVIFLFFILMNKQSRSLWLNIKRMCFCKD